jgi:hypothetical protein
MLEVKIQDFCTIPHNRFRLYQVIEQRALRLLVSNDRTAA